tara:strand:- start:343 stop:531 length:189 start_codon:yes stop_codon:yes gene_type:complete
MNQSSVILLLCLSPIVVIFLVIKISLWITETMRFSSETEKLKRMQHGPYIVWDDEEDENENY